jgi:hypothetical protein
MIADTTDAVDGAAVVLGDDDVLGHVDQAPREVTGVGGLERGVGQALARAVGRDEVLEDGQALAEVGVIGVSMTSPEGLDIRPRMPASWRTCSREPRAPESAIRNIGLNSPFSFSSSLHLAEHLLGDPLGDPVPDVDDLVVRSPAVITPAERWPSISSTSTRAPRDLLLVGRDHHVVDAEGDTRLGGVGEGHLLDLVEHLAR